MSKQSRASVAEVQRSQESIDAFTAFLRWCIENDHTITAAEGARAQLALLGDDDALIWLKTQGQERMARIGMAAMIKGK